MVYGLRKQRDRKGATVKRLVCVAAIAALAACSGHAGSVIPSTTHGSNGTTPLKFSIKIPVATAATGARAQHVSSSTLGVAAAPAGADEMVVTTYDQTPNGSGAFAGTANKLDTGVVDFTVLAGQANTISVTLGGIPAQITVAIDNPNAQFDTSLYADIPYNVEVTALDASGAMIIGSDPYARSILLSTSTGNASFTVDGSSSAVVAKPDSVVTMIDSSPSRAVPTLTANAGGGVLGTQGYAVNPLGKTVAFSAQTGPTAIVSGTGSDEIGQPGDLFYADANQEIVKFDALTLSGASPLTYAGQTPPALATTALVQNRFAGIDVSFVTASDGTQVWIGNSDGTSAGMGNTVPATANCTITNASTGSRILACGDTIVDADTLVASTFAGRTFGGIATGTAGLLYYAYNAGGTGGIGSMAPADVGGSTDATVALPSGQYGTRIVACPNGTLYFIDVRSSDGDLFYGTDNGSIYRVPFATNTAALVSSQAGSIGGIALGPDGAIWATNTPQNQLLRIIP